MISYHVTIFKSFYCLSSSSSFLEMASKLFPQASKSCIVRKVKIYVSFMKRSKSLLKTLKRIASNVSLKGEPIFIVFEKRNFLWVLDYFCHLHVTLDLQLSNHGWNSHKLLISPLTTFQQFHQADPNTSVNFEDLQRHIGHHTLSWIHRAETNKICLKNIICP